MINWIVKEPRWGLFTNNLGHPLDRFKFNAQMNLLKQSQNSVFPVICICSRESIGLIKDVFQKVLFEMDEAASTVLPNVYGILLIFCLNEL